jgi:hypothetical protein
MVRLLVHNNSTNLQWLDIMHITYSNHTLADFWPWCGHAKLGSPSPKHGAFVSSCPIAMTMGDWHHCPKALSLAMKFGSQC